MDGTEAAFRWIVSVLRRRNVPFQVVGGLAARVYGATRPLADIDLYVPATGLERILPDVRPFVTAGPTRHRDEHWDLTFIRLEFAGQSVELGVADEAKIKDTRNDRWVDADIDFAVGVEREVLGVMVPVMPQPALMAYKALLGRDVDRLDLEALVRSHD